LLQLPTEDSALFRHAVNVCTTPLLIIAPDDGVQRVVYANAAFARSSGYGADEIIGCDWGMLAAADAAREGGPYAALRAAMRNGREERATFCAHGHDGATLWLDMHVAPLRADPYAALYIAEIHNVTRARAEHDSLEYRAHYDPLTRLANRYLLQDRFQQAIARTVRSGGAFAVVLIDVDGLKLINDSFGHDTGDELLRQIGTRLAGAIRATDTAARIGGDEFVLLLADIAERPAAAHALGRLIEVLQMPITIGGREIAVSCSVGVTRYPEGGRDPAALLRTADRAMYDYKLRMRRPQRGHRPERALF
jgi:diguanylate cyclase (GGDEF)-like protein/PAS domain S-box-containing protein